ncbi:hypothetical protein AMAG_14121, partial [Allomyces macrogynus ATCC 38327]
MIRDQAMTTQQPNDPEKREQLQPNVEHNKQAEEGQHDGVGARIEENKDQQEKLDAEQGDVGTRVEDKLGALGEMGQKGDGRKDGSVEDEIVLIKKDAQVGGGEQIKDGDGLTQTEEVAGDGGAVGDTQNNNGAMGKVQEEGEDCKKGTADGEEDMESLPSKGDVQVTEDARDDDGDKGAQNKGDGHGEKSDCGKESNESGLTEADKQGKQIEECDVGQGHVLGRESKSQLPGILDQVLKDEEELELAKAKEMVAVARRTVQARALVCSSALKAACTVLEAEWAQLTEAAESKGIKKESLPDQINVAMETVECVQVALRDFDGDVHAALTPQQDEHQTVDVVTAVVANLASLLPAGACGPEDLAKMKMGSASGHLIIAGPLQNGPKSALICPF